MHSLRPLSPHSTVPECMGRKPETQCNGVHLPEATQRRCEDLGLEPGRLDSAASPLLSSVLPFEAESTTGGHLNWS